MVQVIVLVGVAAVAVVVAAVLRRTQRAEPERGPAWNVPALVDRGDFERPDAPWLVAVFTSATCLACGDAWDKAKLLESEAVAVQQVDATVRKDLHDRYGIDAVPMLLVVDEVGSVRRHFVGPPTATDLWAALAELREPGSVPPECTTET